MLGDSGLAEPAAAGAATPAAAAAAADAPQAVERLRAAALLQGTPQWQPSEPLLHDARGRGDVWAVGAAGHGLCHGDARPVDMARRPRGVGSDAGAKLSVARRPQWAGQALPT